MYVAQSYAGILCTYTSKNVHSSSLLPLFLRLCPSGSAYKSIAQQLAERYIEGLNASYLNSYHSRRSRRGYARKIQHDYCRYRDDSSTSHADVRFNTEQRNFPPSRITNSPSQFGEVGKLSPGLIEDPSRAPVYY